jgi:hypothetical protein
MIAKIDVLEWSSYWLYTGENRPASQRCRKQNQAKTPILEGEKVRWHGKCVAHIWFLKFQFGREKYGDVGLPNHEKTACVPLPPSFPNSGFIIESLLPAPQQANFSEGWTEPEIDPCIRRRGQLRQS